MLLYFIQLVWRLDWLHSNMTSQDLVFVWIYWSSYIQFHLKPCQTYVLLAQLVIIYVIIFHSIGMEAGLAAFKYDLSRPGLRMDLLVFVYTVPFETMPNICSACSVSDNLCYYISFNWHGGWTGCIQI